MLHECGPRSFTPQTLFDLTMSPLHIDLRCGESLLRLACLEAAGQHPECGKTHPDYPKYIQKMKDIEQAYLDGDEKVILNKILPGNKGTSNTGIMK